MKAIPQRTNLTLKKKELAQPRAFLARVASSVIPKGRVTGYTSAGSIDEVQFPCCSCGERRRVARGRRRSFRRRRRLVKGVASEQP